MKKKKIIIFQPGLRTWYKHVYPNFGDYRGYIEALTYDLRIVLDENNTTK